jgi:hypothetical protein
MIFKREMKFRSKDHRMIKVKRVKIRRKRIIKKSKK